jgi:hypothetical protein
METAIVNGLGVIKNVKLPEGMYVVGEFRGVESRPHGDKTYYKMKVLNGDYMKKYDIKPEQYGELKNLPPAGKTIVVRYYEFPAKFDRTVMNSVCNEFIMQG